MGAHASREPPKPPLQMCCSRFGPLGSAVARQPITRSAFRRLGSAMETTPTPKRSRQTSSPSGSQESLSVSSDPATITTAKTDMDAISGPRMAEAVAPMTPMPDDRIVAKEESFTSATDEPLCAPRRRGSSKGGRVVAAQDASSESSDEQHQEFAFEGSIFNHGRIA